MALTDFSFIDSIVDKHKLILGIVINSNGETLYKYGNSDSKEINTLLSCLVGPNGNPKGTFDSLDGQILPRMWSQGNAYSFIHKPSPDFMVIFFSYGQLKVLEKASKSRLIDDEIAELVGSTVNTD